MIRRDLVLASRRPASQLSAGRSPAMPARAVLTTTYEGVNFSVAASETRSMNVPQVAYFSSGVLA